MVSITVLGGVFLHFLVESELLVEVLPVGVLPDRVRGLPGYYEAVLAEERRCMGLLRLGDHGRCLGIWKGRLKMWF